MNPPEQTRHSAARAAYAIAPGVLLAGVAGGIAFPILPSVGLHAGLPLPFIGVILAANRVGRVVSAPLIGVATDRFGGRRLLIGGLLIQTAVLLLYWAGIVTGRPGLFFLLGRALHGPGSACVFVSGQTLALHAGGKSHGGMAAGTVRAAMTVGMPLGLVAGGVLSARLGDAATFQVATVAMLAAAVAAWALVDDLRAPATRGFRLRDALAATADRRMVAVGALNFSVAFSALGLVLTTLVLMVDARHISLAGLSGRETSAALMGGMVIISGLSTLVASRLTRTVRQHTWVAVAGCMLVPPGLLMIGLDPSVRGLAIGIAVLALGSGALGSALLALVGDFAGAERRGASVGWLQLCADTGGTIGPILGTSLFAADAATPFVACAVLSACFVPVGLWLVRNAEVQFDDGKTSTA